MKFQLSLVLIFMIINAVLVQISFGLSEPDRHERNRCRPPNCQPSRREPGTGKKISEKDEAPIDENSLKLDETTKATSPQQENALNSDPSPSPNPSSNPSSSSSPNPTTTVPVEIIEPENVTTSEENKTSTSTATPTPTETSSTTAQENIVSNSTSTPTPTPTLLEIISPIITTLEPEESSAITTIITTERIPTMFEIINRNNTDNVTGEIRIPVEVKVIPPSRDELGGLTGHCPETFRYHNESGMCYIPGSDENPCGKGMQFVEEPETNAYGMCECQSFSGCDYRPLLHYPKANGCFHLFDQGPCKSDEWLIIGSNKEAICSKRTCPSNEDANNVNYWFSFKDICYQLSTKAFCKNLLETAQYKLGSLEPTCSLEIIKSPLCALIGHVKHITVGLGLGCPPGQKSTGSGGCASIIPF